MYISKYFKQGICFIILVFIVKVGFTQDPNFHIYLCFGQSNMSGQGPFTDADKNVDSRFKVLRAANHSGQMVGQFYPAAPPLGHSGSQMGPADFFGRKMIQLLPPEISVAVANISIGGQSIDLFDKATSASYISAARAANEWWMQYLDEYGGDPYQRIIEMGQIAKQNGVIKGILFHQGEADANRSDWGAKVKKVYEDIINDLGLNAGEVTILLGELLTTEEGGDLGWRNPAIAEAANNIPNGHLISAAGCPGIVEPNYTLHFTREGYEILGERYAQTMFELLTPTGAPIVDIVSPVATDILFNNETVQIIANATDNEGSVVNVECFIDDVKLGETSSAPYTFQWTNATVGIHTIRVVATDNDNIEGSASTSVTIRIPQAPYEGTPYEIPGTIECENFDVGGNNIAYFDADAGTNVDPAPSFRTDEDVDIETCTDTGGGYNIGWTIAGEWLEYTVDIKTSGTYNLNLRGACNGDNRTVSISIDDVVIASNIAIANTGSWQTWSDNVVENLELQSGTYILKLTIGATDYVNLNYMAFTLVSSANQPIQLSAGWNLIGCPLEGSTNINEALSSIWDKVVSVKDMDSFYLNSQAEYLNTLNTLIWGKGYVVKVSEPCELSW